MLGVLSNEVIKVKNSSQIRNHPKGPQPRRDVCIFRNEDGELYAFPATWQNMFDFFKSKDEFKVEPEKLNGVTHCANDMPWGKRFETPTSFLFGGKKGESIVLIISTVAESKRMEIPVGHSFCVAYR